MCVGLADKEIRQQKLKPFKITDTAHRALELAKGIHQVIMSEYASIAIIEAIERDYPDVRDMLKKELTTQQAEEKPSKK